MRSGCDESLKSNSRTPVGLEGVPWSYPIPGMDQFARAGRASAVPGSGHCAACGYPAFCARLHSGEPRFHGREMGSAQMATVKRNNKADLIQSGTGNDAIDAGNGNDIVDAGQGNDNVRGGNGNDTLFGGAGNDT